MTVTKWQVTCHTETVNSRHANPALTARPPRPVLEAARRRVADAGWQMEQFVTAFLVAVDQQPDEVFALLQPHQPPPKPKGRPRRRAEES